MAEHRVPMLSPVLHKHPDPEHSRDPRIRALVGQLRGVEVPGPRPEFRAELRTQLVAITPRVVAEGDAPVTTKRRPSPGRAAASAPARAPKTPGKTPGRLRAGLSRLGHVHVGRPLAVLTSIVAVFALLLGGAVWISKRALPGDALYGLKRASENVQEAMTSGDSSRAKLLFDFADNRYDEVSDLLPGKGAAVSDHTASLMGSTLDSADSDLKQGMQALGAQAIRTRSGAGLALATSWAPAEVTELRKIAAQLPAGSAQRRAASSLALLDNAYKRARTLKALGSCSCLAHASTDDLGAVPCNTCSSAVAPPLAPSTGTHPTAPGATQRHNAATTARGGASQPGATASTGAGSSRPAGSAGGTSPASSGSAGGPGVPVLPTVPNLLPTGSCAGVDVGLLSVGPCGVGLGH